MHGVPGEAAARRAAEASSRDRESAKGLSLVVNAAPGRRESRSAAMRRDAPVSDSSTMEECGRTTIQFKKEMTYPSLYPLNSLEAHEICPEQNAGDVVWRKTPAGDEAAAACPADASGAAMTGTCFVCSPLTCLTVRQLPSGACRNNTFSYNRPDSAPVQPGRCGSRLLGESNSHQVCF